MSKIDLVKAYHFLSWGKDLKLVAIVFFILLSYML